MRINSESHSAVHDHMKMADCFPERFPYGAQLEVDVSLVRREVNFKMFEFLHALRNREDGQALVEYGLILGLIAVVCIGALELLGGNVSALLDEVAAAIGAV